MTEEYGEILILKSEYGAKLSAEESRALEQLLATREGRAVQAGIRATRALASRGLAGDVGALTSEEAASMRARFEERIREQAGGVRKQMLGFIAVTFGAAIIGTCFFGYVLPLFHPKQPGPGDVASLWILTLGAATLFCATMYYRLTLIHRAPNLFDQLTGRERRVPRTIKAHLRKFPIFLLLVLWWARDLGWWRSAATVLTLWIAFAVTAHFLRGRLRKERMGEDQELWTWWYGEVERGD